MADRAAPMHTKWARAGTPSPWAAWATSRVWPPVDPAAPLVTLIKAGRSRAVSLTIGRASARGWWALGGNNSQESVPRPLLSKSIIFMRYTLKR